MNDAMNTVNYSVDGAVASVTLNRPQQLNAFDISMRAELAQALSRAAEDSAVRVVLLTGAGRAFSAGADLKAGMPPQGQTVEQQLQNEYRPSLDLIDQMPKPVIAAINGPCAGIALGYALHCDLAIMSQDAYLLAPFATISLLPDGGINWQLVRRVGYKKAYQLAIECTRISAEQALNLGLVNRIVPKDELLSEGMSWAADLTQRAPLSLAATKKVMRHAMQNTWQASFDLEARTQVDLLGSEDNLEGVSAFFEKRSAVFKGQ